MQEPSPPADVASSTCEIRVRFCETDLMGIVHHASYLTYFEAARVEWLRSRGVTYADWARRGIHLPVVDASVRYRAPAYFDDVLVIVTRISELKSHSLRYDYRTTRAGLVLAEGSTRLACVGNDHKLKRIPAEVVGILRAGEVPTPAKGALG
jgi:acyl-CoA thioester hydrolase